jgi:hypothetical protein
VVNMGLFDAATATGSCDMPATEPGPLGTFCAYAAQPFPTRSAAGSAIALVMAGAELVMAALEEVLADVLEAGVVVLEQAEAPSIATALRPAAAIALR